MGNFFAYPKCEPTTKNESVISISNTCIHRLTNKNEKYAPENPAQNDDIPLTDNEWISHLQQLDDIHSRNNGLTNQEIEELMNRVEKQIGTIRSNICSTEKLITCLRKYPHCPIKCKHNVDEFIDCINKSRIDIIKENIEEDERCRQLENIALLEQEIKS